MNHWRYRFFVTLTIGRVLPPDEFGKLWRCFRDGLRYRYDEIEYFFIKEIQHPSVIDLDGGEIPVDNLHLHGVVVSNTHDNVDELPAIFNKYLEKKCQIKRFTNEHEISEVKSDVAIAKYVTKDMTRPPRVVIPQSGVIRRWALPSRGFWGLPGGVPETTSVV